MRQWLDKTFVHDQIHQTQCMAVMQRITGYLYSNIINKSFNNHNYYYQRKNQTNVHNYQPRAKVQIKIKIRLSHLISPVPTIQVIEITATMNHSL